MLINVKKIKNTFKIFWVESRVGFLTLLDFIQTVFQLFRTLYFWDPNYAIFFLPTAMLEKLKPRLKTTIYRIRNTVFISFTLQTVLLLR